MALRRQVLNPGRLDVPHHLSHRSALALANPRSEHSRHAVASVSSSASALAVQSGLFAGPNLPPPTQISDTAQSRVETTGVAKACASAAGIPNDSQQLIRQN